MSNSHYSNLVGKLVRVNRGGPESSEGLLLAAKSDYIVVFVKHEGVVYYNLEHIKSITLLNKPTKHFDKHGQHHDIHRKHKKSPTFLDALRARKHHLIKINRGGPDSIIGVLTDVNRNSITLIDNEETVIIFTQHIKSFSPSLRLVNQYKAAHKKDHKDNKDNKDNKNHKEKDHSDNKEKK